MKKRKLSIGSTLYLIALAFTVLTFIVVIGYEVLVLVLKWMK